MRLALRLHFAIVATLFCVSCDENTTSTKSVNNPSPATSASANGTSAGGFDAKYTFIPAKGDVTTKYKFDASSSQGEITSYSWDFGDGKKGTGQTIKHRFRKKGKYKVKLTVSDGNKSDVEMKTIRVREEGGGGGDEQEVKCKYTNPPRDVWFFKVLSQDQATKTIIAQFEKPAQCSDVFYLCGDVRIGGIKDGEKEYWIGIICEMWSRGDNKFRIQLTNGKYWVDTGETGTYVWPQYDCDPHIYCKDFGY